MELYKKIKHRFDELHILARKCSCVIACNIINEQFKHLITYFIVIDKEQFNIERKMILVSMTVPTLQGKGIMFEKRGKRPP